MEFKDMLDILIHIICLCLIKFSLDLQGLRHSMTCTVCECVAAYPMLDVMVAADQGCGCSELLFRREVGIWKTTWRDSKTSIIVLAQAVKIYMN